MNGELIGKGGALTRSLLFSMPVERGGEGGGTKAHLVTGRYE